MLYFSLTTLTTTGYGDIVRGRSVRPQPGQSGVGHRAILSRHHGCPPGDIGTRRPPPMTSTMIETMLISARPASIAQRLLPVLGWLPALPARLVVAGCPGRPRGLGGHGAGGHGLCRHRRRAADHGTLHNRPAIDCLRAARHLASAGRRPGHRDRPDLRPDRGRHRGTGNCGLQYAHLHPRNLDRRLLPALRRAAHGLGGCLHPHARDARVHRRPCMRHHHRPGAASAGHRRHVRQLLHQALVRAAASTGRLARPGADRLAQPRSDAVAAPPGAPHTRGAGGRGRGHDPRRPARR